MKFKDLCKYAENKGWTLQRTSGSHHIYAKPGKRPVPLQKHSKEIEGAYLKMILKQLDG